MKMSIHTSKKGLVFHSGMTDKFYLVTKWKEHENGNIEALSKKEISPDRVTQDEKGRLILKE